jgi:hypothetical protein
MRLYALFCSQTNIPTRYHTKHIPNPFDTGLLLKGFRSSKAGESGWQSVLYMHTCIQKHKHTHTHTHTHTYTNKHKHTHSWYKGVFLKLCLPAVSCSNSSLFLKKPYWATEKHIWCAVNRAGAFHYSSELCMSDLHGNAVWVKIALFFPFHMERSDIRVRKITVSPSCTTLIE